MVTSLLPHGAGLFLSWKVASMPGPFAFVNQRSIYGARYLAAQTSTRPVEIIVVDNIPASALTPPVAAEFPEVVLVREPRKGLAYARNAGFVVSKGQIVAATDDDVMVPPGWLEKLLAPLVRSDVMVVSGIVLPLELETHAQRLFEIYGGLGH
jgi:glycosyltransferase involved in cell wall biosynthesis